MSEKLAWAAGLFEGEGSTIVQKNKPFINGTHYTYTIFRLCVTQASNDGVPEVLLRFHKAVNNLGRMYGPYQRKGNYKQVYKWQASNDQAKAVLRLLWPYLGEVKREQATKAGFLYFPDLTIVSDAS